jgi:MoaA/NifB/PqqE/SkfB family radical SAM enzyme
MDCNITCKHCYLGDRLNTGPHLQYDVAKEFVDRFAHYEGQKEVTFLGGEPMLWEHDLGKLSSYGNSLGYDVKIDTNGFYDPSLFDKLDPDDFKWVSFSLDGATAGTHDTQRRPGSYNAVTSNIKQAIDAGFDTRAISTVSEINYDETAEIVNLLQHLGVERLNVHLVSQNGNASESGIGIHPIDWLKKAVRLYKMDDLEIRFPLSYIPVPVYDSLEPEMMEGMGCKIPNLERFTLFPNGKVYSCSLMFDERDMNLGQFDPGRGVIMNDESEFHESQGRDDCLAMDEGAVIDDSSVVPICRFFRVKNADEKYREMMNSIENFVA